MSGHDQILKFINHFTLNGERKEVIDCFTNGCCYWFAHILEERFIGYIVYNPVIGHFAFLSINDNIYDITGCIHLQEDYIYWADRCNTWIKLDSLRKKDPAWYNRLMKQCRSFKE